METNKKNVFISFLFTTILLMSFFLFWALKSVTWQYSQEIYNKDTLVLYPVIFKYLFSISALQERILFSALPFFSVIALIFFKKIARESRFLIYGIIFIQFCTISLLLFRIIDTYKLNSPKNNYINSKLIERRKIFITNIEKDSIKFSDYNFKALAYSGSIFNLDSIVYLFDFLEKTSKYKSHTFNGYQNLILLYDSVSSNEKVRNIRNNYYPKLSYIVKRINGTDDIINLLPELHYESFYDNQELLYNFDNIANEEYDGNIEQKISSWYKYFKIRDGFFISETEFPKLYFNICVNIFNMQKSFGEDTIDYISNVSQNILFNSDFSSYCRLFIDNPYYFNNLIIRINDLENSTYLAPGQIYTLLDIEKELIESKRVEHYHQLGKILSRYINVIESSKDSCFAVIPLLWNPTEFGNRDLYFHILLLTESWSEVIAKTNNIEENKSQFGYAVLAIASKAKGDEVKYEKYKEEAVVFDIINPGEHFLSYAKYFGNYHNDSILFIAMKYIQFAKLFADDIEYGGYLGIGKKKIFNKDFKLECFTTSASIYEKLKMYENAIDDFKLAKSIDELGNVIQYDKKIIELQKELELTE